MKFTYQLSKQAAQAAFIATGDGDSSRFIDIPLESLAPESRKLLLDAGLNSSYNTGVSFSSPISLPDTPTGVDTYKDPDGKAKFTTTTTYLDHVLDAAGEWFAELAKILAARESFAPALAAKQAEFDAAAEAARAKRHQEKRDEIQHAIANHYPGTNLSDWKDVDLGGLVGQYRAMLPQFEAEKKAREEAGEAARKVEAAKAYEAKVAWAQIHGSDYLKRGLAAGHSCDRLYWLERTAIEYPGCIIDYEKNVDWKDRACPSVKALDARDALLSSHPNATVTIVWLTDEPRAYKLREDAEQFEEEFDPCEAVVVDDPDYTRYVVKTV